MSFLSWNCRGLGLPCTVRVLKDMLRDVKPIFIFLIKTLSFASRLEEFRVRFGYDYCFAVDIGCRSGGLAILWKISFHCDVMNY